MQLNFKEIFTAFMVLFAVIDIIGNIPIIVDAGVGTASHATKAMEQGIDGILMNTAIAHARDAVKMATAMRMGVEAGRLAYESGRMQEKLYAQASSPVEGMIE